MERTKMLTEKEKLDVIDMYAVQLIPMSDIGAIFGKSRGRIYQILKDAGVDTSKKLIDVSCTVCSKIVSRPRCQIRKTKRHFCGYDCYHAWLDNRSDGKYWRHGQRIARQLVSEVFDLQPGHVVHHVDGNNYHNLLPNFWVFACQGDHLRYHRGFDAEPIWKGDEYSEGKAA